MKNSYGSIRKVCVTERLLRTDALMACLALIIVMMASAAHAQSLRGPARVIDGDTLAVSGMEVRLFGVDAPELGQKCVDGATSIACGEMAKDALASLIGDATLSCTRKSTDPYGRMVAVCYIGSADVGQALVDAGWATAYRRYSEDYVAAETRARASRAGMWQWGIQNPEEYRIATQPDVTRPRENRAQARATQSPRRYEQQGRCLIKGNHSRRGDWIYHLPGMPYYDATRPEAWFCTEAEAQAAGYRRAIVR